MNTPPLPAARRHDLPVDMAAHITTPLMRVLGVIVFCILAYGSFHLYQNALAPVMLGDSVFVLDADGPRLAGEHNHNARISADSVTEVVFQLLFGPPVRIKTTSHHDRFEGEIEF